MTKIHLSKPQFVNRDYKTVLKSLKTGWLTHGQNNLIFEQNFSKLVGCKYSVAMNSCTSALECSLKILKKKGEIILPSWTWVSTANAILNTGNVPVVADVDVNSGNLTAKKIKERITKKTIAVIVVHYAGLPCEMDEILKLTNKQKISLIEDSAETLGAKWKNKHTGFVNSMIESFERGLGRAEQVDPAMEFFLKGKDMSEEEKKDKLLSNFKNWGKENRRWINKIPRNIIKKIMGRLD